MTIDQKALEASAKALSVEHWGSDADWRMHSKDASVAITAYLAALPASDHAGLVERLEARAKFQTAIIKLDKMGFYEKTDAALMREAATALSAGVRVKPIREDEAIGEDWRDLALQFDEHRIQALEVIRALLRGDCDQRKAKEFLASPPLSGKVIYDQIIAEARSRGTLSDAPVVTAPPQQPVAEPKAVTEEMVDLAAAQLMQYGLNAPESTIYAAAKSALTSALSHPTGE